MPQNLDLMSAIGSVFVSITSETSSAVSMTNKFPPDKGEQSTLIVNAVHLCKLGIQTSNPEFGYR